METAVTENIGEGCATNILKSKVEQSPKEQSHAERTTSNDCQNVWKLNRESNGLTPAFAKNVQSLKSLHSINGTNGGISAAHGHYGGSSNSFNDKDSRAKPRHKYNKPAPKIVEPIVTDKEEDWPTLGIAAGGLGSNGNGLLNGFVTKNHKRSTSNTDSPSTSSRTNSIIGQDDAERASVVSGDGSDHSNLDVDQVDGELTNKLRDVCVLKPDDAELPKETNNNETRKSEEEITSDKKTQSRSGRGKLKWKPLPLPNIPPNRTLRPRRWEEKDSSARNGSSRVAQSMITFFGNSHHDSSEHGTNATSTVQRGRGHAKTSVGRGGHHDSHGHAEDDDGYGHRADYYENKRRSNSFGDRAYYGGRPRGGGGRWQHSRGSGASRSGRHEDEEAGTSARGSQTNHDVVESQEIHHAGNGGGNSKSYAGAISNTNKSTGSKSADYDYASKNPLPLYEAEYPPEYGVVSTASYPADDGTSTTFVTTQALLPTSLTITTTTTITDPPALTSSTSQIVTTVVHEYIVPYSPPRSTQSPVISSPTGEMVVLGSPTTMEQVVDEQRLRTMVTKQIMYYLSEENLEQDFYLRRQMNAEGYIEIAILAGFHRLKGMTSNLALILEVILSCPDKFEVNHDMSHVRPRLNPTMWPVVNEGEVEPGPDPTPTMRTESTSMEPVVSYNTEYPHAGYYTVNSVSATITTIVSENHGYHNVQSISSASSTSSSLSPGLLRPFRLNPDVPEFVPRGFANSSDKKEEARGKPE